MYEDIGSSLSSYFLIAACRELWFLTRVARRVRAGQCCTSPLGGACPLAGGGLGGGGAVGDLARALVFGMRTGPDLSGAPGIVRRRAPPSARPPSALLVPPRPWPARSPTLHAAAEVPPAVLTPRTKRNRYVRRNPTWGLPRRPRAPGVAAELRKPRCITHVPSSWPATSTAGPSSAKPERTQRFPRHCPRKTTFIEGTPGLAAPVAEVPADARRFLQVGERA
jgi:hypothetical protein